MHSTLHFSQSEMPSACNLLFRFWLANKSVVDRDFYGSMKSTSLAKLAYSVQHI